MPLEINCPACSTKLRVGDDKLGKKVRCPKCKEIFTAEEATEPVKVLDELPEAPVERPPSRRDFEAEDDEEPRPRGKNKRMQSDSVKSVKPVSKGMYLGGVAGCLVLTLVGIGASYGLMFAGAANRNQTLVTIGQVLMCPSIVPMILGTVLLMMLIYKMWDAIQDGNSRTTPGMAVGLMFIPLFNIYWMFQVYYGWAVDYNRYVDQREISAPRMSEGLALWVCICPLIGFCIPCIPGLVSLVLLVMFLSSAIDCVNALAAAQAPQEDY